MMKKLSFTIIAIIFFMNALSASKVNAGVEIEDSYDLCGIYANQIATETQQNGGNYWSAWFYAYSYCDSVVYQNEQ